MSEFCEKLEKRLQMMEKRLAGGSSRVDDLAQHFRQVTEKVHEVRNWKLLVSLVQLPRHRVDCNLRRWASKERVQYPALRIGTTPGPPSDHGVVIKSFSSTALTFTPTPTHMKTRTLTVAHVQPVILGDVRRLRKRFYGRRLRFCSEASSRSRCGVAPSRRRIQQQRWVSEHRLEMGPC